MLIKTHRTVTTKTSTPCLMLNLRTKNRINPISKDPAAIAPAI